ncbi:unnamed protein product [Strongylus vulgaris]|uniref:Uncharacterized protein n=1 Tax=Strongylus vulgaris TaxID=40348 RepID=A0A3P7I6G4_STRVU|nr:unnamed protein product [Strongylus vulgaris]
MIISGIRLECLQSVLEQAADLTKKDFLQDPARRVEDALTCIGWPLIQVGLSTIVAVLPPLLKPSYMVLVFFKTVIVVCSLGMFHGLVVMPAILTAVVRRKDDSW